MIKKTAAIAMKACEPALLFKALTLSVMATVLLAMMVGAAHAGAASGVVTAFTGLKDDALLVAAPLATIAIIALGIGAMFGRITWNQALIVAMGIIIAVKAGDVYNAIVGPTTVVANNTSR